MVNTLQQAVLLYLITVIPESSFACLRDKELGGGREGWGGGGGGGGGGLDTTNIFVYNNIIYICMFTSTNSLCNCSHVPY